VPQHYIINTQLVISTDNELQPSHSILLPFQWLCHNNTCVAVQVLSIFLSLHLQQQLQKKTPRPSQRLQPVYWAKNKSIISSVDKESICHMVSWYMHKCNSEKYSLACGDFFKTHKCSPAVSAGLLYRISPKTGQ
jgi:hypothetical protein